MNQFTGWIKLYRKMMNKAFYLKSQYVHLWLHILLNVNHETKEFLWNNETVKVSEGQMLTGRKQLANETGIAQSTIEKILKYLEKEHQIEQQKTTKFRLITVKNWKDYQEKEQEKEQQRNNSVTTEEQQRDTNKNVKNVKNDKNIMQPEAAGVNKIMNVFYQINPTLNYGNKTQRSAADRLIKKLGEDKAIKSAEAATMIHGQPYAPTITTPLELERDLSKLIAFYKKNQSNQIVEI